MVRQIRYLQFLPLCDTAKEAGERAGVPYDTVRRWHSSDDNFKRAVELLKEDGANLARETLRRHVPKAAEVKVAGLDSEIEWMQQRCATEILEWFLGKAAETVNVQGEWVTLLRELRETPDVDAKA